MTEPSMPHIPVLVVGAGPTGLTLAAALTRYGIPVRLVEKKPALSRHTKASNLMLRSQEVLAALGLRMPVAEIGGPMRRIMWHGHGRCFGPRTMQQPDTPFPGVLLCGQNRLEEAVCGGLARSGVRVEFATELTHAEPTGDGVVATLAGPAGVTRVRCDYLVGCDGAAGPTRTFTKHDFRPHRTGVAVRQVDCRLSWRRSSTQDQMWLFYFRNGFVAVVPLPGGMYRIATHEPIDRLPNGKPTLPEMEAKLREVTGDPSVRLADLDWSTHTDLSMGIAGGLRDGRVILAGDSGNPILPNGGQGMNVGIVDAFNLGWKLAAVVNGGPDALLDSYEAERHAVRRALEKVQYNSLKYTTLVTPWWMRAVVRLALEPLLNRGGERAAARAFSQLGETYRRGPLTLDLVGRRGLRAGDRAPDADVVGASSVQLFDLIYAGGWTLLAFTGRRTSAAAATAAAAFGRPDLAGYVVTTDAAVVSAEVPVLYDLDEVAHRAYRVTRSTLYLIRPDGHVGGRVHPKDVGRLAEYAARWVPVDTLAAVENPFRSADPVATPVWLRPSA